MTVTVSEYSLKKAEFREDDVKSILCGAVGFNPRFSKIEILTDSFNKVVIEEKISTFAQALGQNNFDPTSEENISLVLGQLDMWGGSDDQGNEMAIRAAELIRALITNKGNN